MLKLNVGFTKKVGEANYGSRGAAVNLELELDSSLVGDVDRLRERVRHLFGLAKASVDEELAPAASAAPTNGHEQPLQNGNGKRRDGTRYATASQVRALNPSPSVGRSTWRPCWSSGSRSTTRRP